MVGSALTPWDRPNRPKAKLPGFPLVEPERTLESSPAVSKRTRKPAELQPKVRPFYDTDLYTQATPALVLYGTGPMVSNKINHAHSHHSTAESPF